MEKFGNYKFKLLKNNRGKWSYEIQSDNSMVIHTTELFQLEGIARFAAIGHISLLEQKKRK